MELMLLDERIHSVLLDGLILALSLQKRDLKLLILVLLGERKVLHVAPSQLLLELGLDETLLLDALHGDVVAMEVALELSGTLLAHALLRSDELWVVRVDHASPLLKLHQLPLRLDLSSLHELLLRLLLRELQLLRHQSFLLLCVQMGLAEDLNLVTSSGVGFGGRLRLATLLIAVGLVSWPFEARGPAGGPLLQAYILRSSLWLAFRSFRSLLGGGLVLHLEDFDRV